MPTIDPPTASDGATARAAPASRSVCTRMTFPVALERAWNGLLFFEEISRRPPLHLRLLLPRPIRIEGRKSNVGDEARCLYAGGWLRKRVTLIEPRRRYRFEVVEQQLVVGGGVTLSGGSYTLRERPGGRTDVVLETRYASPRRPRWIWEPIETAVCHLFHRHILGAIRCGVEAR